MPSEEVDRTLVLLNPSAGVNGDPALRDRIRQALERAEIPGIDFISLQPGWDEHLGRTFRRVIAVGGDGTVNAAASLIVGTDAVLGVIPTGTLNHFARDMNLPSDLDEAALAIAGGRTLPVDVGEVNGRVFVNNSSIGFYPTLALERAEHVKNGMSKTLALIPAALTALYRFPNTTVRLHAEGVGGVVTRTPFVFVGNNRYVFAGLQAGSRASLQDGHLQLCAITSTTRGKLLQKIALALLGRIESDPEVLMEDVAWAEIDTMRRNVRVALDGEVVRLRSPLRYTIRPAALHVCVP